MNLSTLHTRLSTTGYQVAYQFFPDDVLLTTPYITYNVAYSTNFGADGKVYKAINSVQLSLWTDKKNETAEATVENALDFCYWNKSETYEDAQKIYRILYEFKII